ncbi:neutral zinc metallopeptidase, partial [Lapillicoccus jejuensis]
MSTATRPLSTRRPRRLARALAGVAALASVATGVVATSAPAHALNPAQTQYSGVVNLLGFNQSGSIATFWSTTMSAWGARYAKPRLVYYRTSTVGLISTPCGTALANNSFYCSTDNTIYLDYTWNQQNTTRYGDFGSGGILAHEWGHAVDAWLGYAYVGYSSEYHADCLAGMYARYGYATGRLVGSDYSEMWNWLYSQPYGDGSHGTGAMRA